MTTTKHHVPEPDTMPITESSLRQLEGTIGRSAPEQGAMLGGSRADGVVRHVLPDTTARCTSVTYSPDHEVLSRVLSGWWNPSKISLLGWAHSHPTGCTQLSQGDLVYAKDIFATNRQLVRLLLPIITLEPFTIHSYIVEPNGEDVRWRAVQLRVLREEFCDAEAVVPAVAEGRLPKLLRRLRPRPWWEGDAFARVSSAYDLPRLAKCRILGVGVGGALLWYEEMARCGVREFVLIDADHVSLTNIGTSHFYRDEVGRPKVEVARERIRRINPDAKVWVVRQHLDRLSDARLARLAGLRKQRPPLVTLLAAMTDSFPAQARMNRLALHLGLPLLSAQVYAAGAGAEVVWSYPDVSQTCQRCVLQSRFRAYLNEGFVNDVTSDGTPIFATTRLTALKSMVALAMLHHGTSHPRWGAMLERMGQRTLLQVRLDPDANLPAFRRAFGDDERVFADETLWIPRHPVLPIHGARTCPDCFVNGASTSLVGKDGDTRLLRRESR